MLVCAVEPKYTASAAKKLFTICLSVGFGFLIVAVFLYRLCLRKPLNVKASADVLLY